MNAFHFHEIHPKAGERSVLIPAGLGTKSELLSFLKTSVPLPDYFGGNWDALEECLGDLEDELVLIHQDIPLDSLPAEQKIYLEILAGAAKKDGSLRISFPARERARIRRLLAGD